MIKNKHSNPSVVPNKLCEEPVGGVIFFTERPAMERGNVVDAVHGDFSNEMINANELFFLFTANIIKENVIFIR